MDFELAAKLSGARFVVLQKGLARMERALGQFMLDLHTGTHGYTEVSPPLLVRDAAMYGTAQLPKFVDDQFFAASTALIREMTETVAPSFAGKDLVERLACIRRARAVSWVYGRQKKGHVTLAYSVCRRVWSVRCRNETTRKGSRHRVRRALKRWGHTVRQVVTW